MWKGENLLCRGLCAQLLSLPKLLRRELIARGSASCSSWRDWKRLRPLRGLIVGAASGEHHITGTAWNQEARTNQQHCQGKAVRSKPTLAACVGCGHSDCCTALGRALGPSRQSSTVCWCQAAALGHHHRLVSPPRSCRNSSGLPRLEAAERAAPLCACSTVGASCGPGVCQSITRSM